MNLDEMEEECTIDDLTENGEKYTRIKTSKVQGMFIKMPLDVEKNGKLISKCKVHEKMYIGENIYGTDNINGKPSNF